MIAKQPCDAFCQNEQCIKSHKSLFTYINDNYHYKNHIEQIKPINAVEFYHCFNMLKQQNYGGGLSSKTILAMLNLTIDKKCQQITHFIRQKYFSGIYEELKNQTQKNDVKDIDELVSQLKNGEDYFLLKKLFYESSNKQNDFVNGLVNGLSARQKQMEKNVNQIGNYILQMIGKTTNEANTNIINQNIEDENNISQRIVQIKMEENGMQQQQQNNMSQYKNQISSKKHTLQYYFKHVDPVNQLKIDQHLDQHQKQISFKSQNQPNQQIIKEKKAKIIHKQNKKNSFSAANLLKKRKNKKMEIIDSQNQLFSQNQKKVQILQIRSNSKQILVKQVSNPEQTLSYICELYPSIEALHIFDPKFAKIKIIVQILKRFSKLQTLTFNCNHQFNQYVPKQISSETIKRITHLELKWNINQFFDQYLYLKYFPLKPKVDNQRTNMIDRLCKIYSYFSNNKSLLIQSKQQLKLLHLNHKNLSKIKILNLVGGDQKKYSINNVYSLKELTNLTTLNLQQVSISLQNGAFINFIANNKQLQHIKITDCLEIQHGTKQFFEILTTLKNLTHLTLEFNSPTVIDIEPLFNLINLESLNLMCIIFKSKTKNSTDSSCLRKIKKLKRLTHLGLYYCQPVYNDLLEYLKDGNILRQLIYLNLGLTKVDDNCKKYLKQMIQLEYLNIDGVKITGKVLADTFAQLYDLFESRSSKLKYLSADQSYLQVDDQLDLGNEDKYEWRHSEYEMKRMAEYLPNLVYLNIFLCHNLSSYNFKDFKSLKNLIVDRVLKEELPVLPKHINVFVE